MPRLKRERPVSDPEAAFVYVVACGDLVKIGVSYDPVKRLQSLRTGMPHRPYIVATRLLSKRKDAYALELRLHRLFHAHRSNGEWFRVNASVAAKALKNVQFHREGDDAQAVVARAFAQGRHELGLL